MQTDWIEIATPHVATKLALKRDGAGPGILFLHGWAHSSLAWQDVVPHFIQSNTCLTVDLPGFGDSPRLDEKHISIDRYADIVWKLLQDLSRQRALQFVVADSLSGLLVLDCLSRFESLPVERFLLSGVPLDGLPKLFRDVQAHAFTGLGLRLLRALPFEIANSLTVRSNHLTVHQRGRFERVITTMIRRSDPTTAGRLLREMYCPYELSETFVPNRYAITLCRGSHDQVFRGAALAPWADALGAIPVTLANSGHTPMLEAPDEYARAITAARQRFAAAPVQDS